MGRAWNSVRIQICDDRRIRRIRARRGLRCAVGISNLLRVRLCGPAAKEDRDSGEHVPRLCSRAGACDIL
jgi:hypothetical protein